MTRTEPRIRHSRLLLAFALTSAASGDTITLRSSVRLATGAAEVRLADIAALEGPLARQHADVVVATLAAGGQAIEIVPAQVRAALDGSGVHWGKVQLSGGRVIVRPPAPAAAGPPLAMTPLALERPAARSDRFLEQRTVDAATVVGELTLRGAVTDRIVRGMGVSATDLRLVFDDHDEQYLSASLEGQRFEIQPLSSFASDRIAVRIRAWAAGRIRDSRSVTVRPLLRTDAVIAQREIDRNQELRETDFAVETRWVSPSASAAMCTLVGAVGRVAGERIKPGHVLRKADLRRETVIERGDRVMVRCLVGGVVITLEAEARRDAAEGDPVELRKLGERASFQAVATGPGEAIVDLSRSP